jgi:hypothetical protein
MILVKFRMGDCRLVATPMAIKIHKRKPDDNACDPTINQLTIGTHLYTLTATRPDIVYDIRGVSQYNHDPRNEHMVAITSVLFYLKGMKDCRVYFAGELGGEKEGALGCYVD